MADDEETKLINKEYKIWKKNTPFLYDMMMSYALEWPSLTCQWLPEKRIDRSNGCSLQRLLVGTHTSGEDENYIMVLETPLPLPQSELEVSRFDDAKLEPFQKTTNRVEAVQRVQHDGEVNRARYMPQRPSIIATKTISSQVLVFDLSKHPSKPDTVGCFPELRLKGHKKEGYGLAFSPLKSGLLASGSDDCLVCVWDIEASLARGARDLLPLCTLNEHNDVVEDVSWHPVNENILASVSDDKSLKIWDLRKKGRAEHTINAHEKEVNAVEFNPFTQFVLATGSSDHTAALWDMRHLNQKIHSFKSHLGEVLSVRWAPFNETIFATSGCDRRVCFWDLARIGEAQSEKDTDDGPPELLFIHGGHTAKLSDLSWNTNHNDEWVIASVAEDNVLQLWRMTDGIYTCEECATLRASDSASSRPQTVNTDLQCASSSAAMVEMQTV